MKCHPPLLRGTRWIQCSLLHQAAQSHPACLPPEPGCGEGGSKLKCVPVFGEILSLAGEGKQSQCKSSKDGTRDKERTRTSAEGGGLRAGVTCPLGHPSGLREGKTPGTNRVGSAALGLGGRWGGVKVRGLQMRGA